nr:hypothetical protein GCM10020241_25300 [Streptoalloteichus tenebrarius]
MGLPAFWDGTTVVPCGEALSHSGGTSLTAQASRLTSHPRTAPALSGGRAPLQPTDNHPTPKGHIGPLWTTPSPVDNPVAQTGERVDTTQKTVHHSRAPGSTFTRGQPPPALGGEPRSSLSSPTPRENGIAATCGQLRPLWITPPVPEKTT